MNAQCVRAGWLSLASVLLLSAAASGDLIGPSPYRSFADSPFGGQLFTYFHLENFEDGALNTPGVSASGPGFPIHGFVGVDSVDGDDGAIDGSGTNGWSRYSGAVRSMTFTFDSTALGGLPTHAGLVWTDVGLTGVPGVDDVTFEAFDANGVGVGTIGPVRVGDGDQVGQTAEDRFFGVVYAGGIARLIMTMAQSGEWEIDHLQYGRMALSSAVPTITNIGTLPGVPSTIGTAVSDDGRVVVGQMGSPGQYRAFRWTAGGGLQGLRTPEVPFESSAQATNADGSVVAGMTESAIGLRAFRWSEQGFSLLPGNFTGQSWVFGLSADGAVAVGYGNVPGRTNQVALRWTPAGYQSLGGLMPDGASYSEDVSSDGLTVAGFAETSQGSRAFRWTAGGGMENLGLLAGTSRSIGTGISADGSTIVGYSEIPPSTRYAFRWRDGQMISLGTLGQSDGCARAANHDGSLIVGYVTGLLPPRAFIWTSTLGMMSLRDYVASLGGDVTGWTFEDAHDITPDGTAITGHGRLNGQGPQAFLIRLRPSCVADFNRDGIITPDDLSDYIACFFSMPPCAGADINADGNVDPDDLSDLIGAYFSTCP